MLPLVLVQHLIYCTACTCTFSFLIYFWDLWANRLQVATPNMSNWVPRHLVTLMCTSQIDVRILNMSPFSCGNCLLFSYSSVRTKKLSSIIRMFRIWCNNARCISWYVFHTRVQKFMIVIDLVFWMHLGVYLKLLASHIPPCRNDTVIAVIKWLIFDQTAREGSCYILARCTWRVHPYQITTSTDLRYMLRDALDPQQQKISTRQLIFKGFRWAVWTGAICGNRKRYISLSQSRIIFTVNILQRLQVFTPNNARSPEHTGSSTSQTRQI